MKQRLQPLEQKSTKLFFCLSDQQGGSEAPGRTPKETHTRIHTLSVQHDGQLMCNEEEKAHLHVAACSCAVFLETGKVEMNSQTNLRLACEISMNTVVVMFCPIHHSCLCSSYILCKEKRNFYHVPKSSNLLSTKMTLHITHPKLSLKRILKKYVSTAGPPGLGFTGLEPFVFVFTAGSSLNQPYTGTFMWPNRVRVGLYVKRHRPETWFKLEVV